MIGIELRLLLSYGHCSAAQATRHGLGTPLLQQQAVTVLWCLWLTSGILGHCYIAVAPKFDTSHLCRVAPA